MRVRLLFLASIGFSASFFLVLPVFVHAQWQFNGVPIATVDYDQRSPVVVPDGLGGALIAWTDGRSSTTDDIYAQRVDASGVVQWTADGVAVCNAAGNQAVGAIAVDGAGGAVVAWSDRRTGDWNVYSQRIDAAGSAQWAANGTAVCTAANTQGLATIVSDGAGGAIVAWEDFRSGTDEDVYVQRIDATGAVLWTADGVPVCTAAGDQSAPEMISDGSGGAIITWDDNRDGDSDDIYAQRVDAAGNALWTTDGVVVASAASSQLFPAIIPDGSAGAVIVWEDFRNGNSDVYVQRIDAAGAPQWTGGGVAVCTDGNSQFDLAIGSDGSGGAVVAWVDSRAGEDIYAQRINGAGAVQWTTDGIAVCAGGQSQSEPAVLADGSGGAVIAWKDGRPIVDSDIYAQRIDGTGAPQWIADGVSLCTAFRDQERVALVSDGSGGTIAVWNDFRNLGWDVYALQFAGEYGTGVGGAPSPAAPRLRNFPNPFGASTELEVELPGRSEVRIEVFNVAGQRLRWFDVAGEEGWQRVPLDASDQRGRPLASGVYFLRVTADGGTATRKVVIMR